MMKKRELSANHFLFEEALRNTFKRWICWGYSKIDSFKKKYLLTETDEKIQNLILSNLL
jgi:hypothetical protein